MPLRVDDEAPNFTAETSLGPIRTGPEPKYGGNGTFQQIA